GGGGTRVGGRRGGAAPRALPVRAPRLSQPRPGAARRSQPCPGALRPAASQASASSAPTTKMTGSGPPISDQSSGFIAPRPPPLDTPEPLARFRGNGPTIDRNRDRVVAARFPGTSRGLATASLACCRPAA